MSSKKGKSSASSSVASSSHHRASRNKITSQGRSMNTRFVSKNDKMNKKMYRGQGR